MWTTAAIINTAFWERVSHFVRRIEEDGLSLFVSIRGSSTQSSVPPSRSAGLTRCSGFTLNEVRIRDMEKKKRWAACTSMKTVKKQH